MISEELLDELGTVIRPVCGFEEAWVGPCKNLNPCPKHDHIKCSKCDNPAIRNCDVTIGPMVCGADLCGQHSCSHRGW